MVKTSIQLGFFFYGPVGFLSFFGGDFVAQWTSHTSDNSPPGFGGDYTRIDQDARIVWKRDKGGQVP